MMGRTETEPTSQPVILPELQNRSIISVVIGDYHYGALTSTGKLYTWGQYSKGALGLGDPLKIEPGLAGGYPDERRRRDAITGRRLPPQVTVPSEVRFDHGSKKPKDMFCFGITAAGWHMGALAMDLDVCSFFT
jgi:SCF-associated factor 1